MILQKAEGVMYSVVLTNALYVAPIDGSMEILEQEVLTCISKVVKYIEAITDKHEMQIPHLEKLRSDLCANMPRFEMRFPYENGECILSVKQHAMKVGVVYEANAMEGETVVSAPPI